jgi:ABC-type multidrug transport system fused ATPase/permease subunit
MLFQGSFRDNLDPSKQASTEELWAALRLAGIDELAEENLDSDVNAT